MMHMVHHSRGYEPNHPAHRPRHSIGRRPGPRHRPLPLGEFVKWGCWGRWIARSGGGKKTMSRGSSPMREEPCRDVSTQWSGESGDSGAKKCNVRRGVKWRLAGGGRGEGFQYQSDPPRPSISTTIDRERSENADRAARSVPVTLGGGVFVKSPTTGGT
jgi:hypothetical protein